MSQWNGVSMLWNQNQYKADISVTSDTSGSWGCGAFALPYWLDAHRTPIIIDSSEGTNSSGTRSSLIWEGVERQDRSVHSGLLSSGQDRQGNI